MHPDDGDRYYSGILLCWYTRLCHRLCWHHDYRADSNRTWIPIHSAFHLHHCLQEAVQTATLANHQLHSVNQLVFLYLSSLVQ